MKHITQCWQLIFLAGFLLAFNTTLCAYPPGEDVTNADVIVYGSTPGGFCAAIAAAREGTSVILLEPTDQNSANDNA